MGPIDMLATIGLGLTFAALAFISGYCFGRAHAIFRTKGEQHVEQ